MNEGNLWAVKDGSSGLCDLVARNDHAGLLPTGRRGGCAFTQKGAEKLASPG
jgi:hypothetical protein